ncbi:MAG: TetR/AcrR family transcriptional regulator [Defluviitaleaceae bacterium]|nr:TetR/AcrR family transcriptional regulator [Defluviitaleaceae bacterium]
MPRNKYPDETRQKIMEESLKLFLDKGYEETTVLDIIKNLGGLTRGAFYHHFKSKEEVLDALFNSLGGGEVPLDRAMQADAANGLERLKLLYKYSLAANVAEEKHVALLSQVVGLLEKPRFFAERHKQLLSSAKAIEPIVEEGMADGSIRKGSAKAYSEIAMLMTSHWIMPNLFPATDRELIERGELMTEIFEAIGMPLIDDEIASLFMGNVDTLGLQM